MPRNELNETVIKARVQRGAELLDEKKPDWFNNVDEEKFVMSNLSRCILGQNYGHYGEGLRKLQLPAHEDAFGFEVPIVMKFDHEPGESYYRLLEKYWLEEIKARKQLVATG